MICVKSVASERCRGPIISLTLLLTAGFLLLNTWNRYVPQREFIWNLIPANYQSCEQVVRNNVAVDFSMSPSYQLKLKAFENAVDNSSVGGREGYSGQLREQYAVMHHLAGQPIVKTVCETGFNLGHSSFNYLTANEDAIVHSFDLGNHQYAHAMSDFVKKMFPSRFFIHFGDSVSTIPKFIQENPGFECDYIFVDGGHVYPVALADLKNFAKIANLKANVIVFDDYPTNWGQPFGEAWEKMRRDGVVQELMRCTFAEVKGLQRGYTFGKVVKRPEGSN